MRSPLAKDYRRFKKEYQGIYRQKGLFIYLDSGELYVVTPISKWHIRPCRDHKYELLHRNTVGETDKYHVQRTFSQNVHSILDYIIKHEEFRYSNLVKDMSYCLFGDDERHLRKGSKRYRKMQKKRDARKKSREIGKVLNLIEKLERHQKKAGSCIGIHGKIISGTAGTEGVFGMKQSMT